MGRKQLGYRLAQSLAYGDYEQSTAKKRTKRERFLSEIEAVVPWKALLDVIESHYPKTSNKGGRHPYPMETLLRIHLLLQWYDLSDPAMEDSLIEVATMQRFAGIALISDRIPDETTILAFRHLLEQNNLGEEIFEAVKAHLKANGMAMKQGTIVDATIIAAPCSTKNKAGERDPEMHKTKKGNQWYHRCAQGFAYGMKVHLGVDSESGRIHFVETTAANVHDLTPAAELLHGEETVVYANAGYQGIEKRPEMQGRGIGFRVAMRPGKRRTNVVGIFPNNAATCCVWIASCWRRRRNGSWTPALLTEATMAKIPEPEEPPYLTDADPSAQPTANIR